MTTVTRLYPLPGQEEALKGLYLNHQIVTLGTTKRPFVYANFLSSLDGRIALDENDGGHPYLPKELTSANDFRLFLELQAQADCLITHGGYLRALVAGRLGNILQVGQREESRDLAVWRKARGLPAQPAIVIASASLDFPLPESISMHQQRCIIVTGEQSDPGRIKAWQARGYPVLRAGHGTMVEGEPLVEQLGKLGFRRLYLIAGPRMLDTMVRAGKLARLYQTISHQLLGGESFHSLLPGPQLGNNGRMQMRTLYYDPPSDHGVGQWFVQFVPCEQQ